MSEKSSPLHEPYRPTTINPPEKEEQKPKGPMSEPYQPVITPPKKEEQLTPPSK